MAIRVQTYNRQVQPTTGRAPTVPNPGAVRGAFGENVYQANQEIGKQISNIGGMLAEHAQEQQKLQNDAFVADQDVKSSMAVQEMLNSPELETVDMNGQKIERPKGYLNRQGLGAGDSLNQFKKSFNDYAQKNIEGIKDPTLKAKVARNLSKTYQSAYDRVSSHEAREWRKGNIDNLEAQRDLKISDPTGVPSDRINEIATLQHNINQANGFGQAKSQLEINNSVGKFMTNLVDAGLQADPTGDASRNMLAEATGKMSQDDVLKLSKRIDNRVKENAIILMDDLNSKFIDGTITLEDIQAANLPREKGGIGSTSAKKMLKDLAGLQTVTLTTIANDSEKAEKYISTIDESLLNPQDNYKAKQILVDAYADGTITQDEAQKLGRIKEIIGKQKFNRDHPSLINVGVIKSWFGANDNDTRELATTLQNYLTVLDSGKSPEDAKDEVLRSQYNKTYPQAPLGKDDKIDDPSRERSLSVVPALQRFGKGFSLGVAGSVEGFGGALRWLKQEELGKAVTDYAQTMKSFYAIPDPKFTDQIAAGVGSMATFFIPGMGIAKGVKAVTLFPRLALWLGVSASTALEATVEAGSTYQRGLEKGMSEKASADSASKDFWINIPTIAITNKLGIFGESGGKFVRTLKASGFEGFQEFSQSVISNIAVHDPALQGAFESAAVGAIVGGGTKMTVEASGALKELGDIKEAIDKFKEKMSSERGSVAISRDGDNTDKLMVHKDSINLPPTTEEQVASINQQERPEYKIEESPEKKEINPKIVKDISQFTDASIVPLSTRLAKVNIGLRDVLHKFEFAKGLATHEDVQKVLPFMKHMEALPTEDSASLDLALKNVDIPTINEIVDRNGIRQEYEQMREVLDDIYNRAKEAGIDVGYIDDYFPRRVNDSEKFLNYLRNSENWSAINKAIKQEEVRVGSRLDNESRAEFINKLLRGYGDSQIRISKPSNIKGRKIQIIDEQMNAFYKNSTTTLQEYIVAMNNMIEAKKFFGFDGKTADESIGAYVGKLVDDGLISHTQEREVKAVIEARFKDRGTHGIWSFYKNMGYLYTMSSPISAITQIGDLGFSLYENGFYNTAVGIQQSFSKNKITKQDLGIDPIIQEFSDNSKSGEVVTKVFKMIGLEAMDNVGKETLINGSLNKMSQQAVAGDPELTAEVQRIFGEEANQTLEDLKNSEPSVNVKYLLFAKLAKYQPIALSEMPEYYAKGGNMRIAYMLKSYTIKQLDVYHNEVFMQFKTSPKRAIGNLVRLSLALATMNAGADVIKDVLLGRPIKLSDLAVDNILRLMGFSKYTIYKAKRQGLGDALYSTILPPFPFLGDLYSDLSKKNKPDVEDMKIWNAVPIVGKFYYWWFGGGRAYLDKKNKTKKIRSAF